MAFSIYINIRDGRTYAPKIFNPEWVAQEGISWVYQQQGGLAQIDVVLAVAWETTPVAAGDFLEVWASGEAVPRARGIVTIPESSLDLKEQMHLAAMGRMADMDKVLDYKVIFHPGGSPQDLALYAAKLFSDYQKRKNAMFSGGIAPYNLVSNVQPTGLLLQSLTMDPSTVRGGLDTLYNQAAGNIVWGWDIDPATGADRFYFALRTQTVGHQFFVGDSVKLLTSPAELDPLVNAVLLRGGPALYPNLLTNPSFEQPTQPSAVGSGSILQNGSFDLPQGDSNVGGSTNANDWTLSSGATRNAYDPGSNHYVSPHTGQWFLLLDGAGESAEQEVNVDLNAPYILALYVARESGFFASKGELTVEGLTRIGGTVTETAGVLALAPQSTAWSGGQGGTTLADDSLTLTVVFSNPSTTAARVTLSCTAGSATNGLCIDDITMSPVGGVAQNQWTYFGDTPTSIDWACESAAWEGAYGVRVKAHGTSSSTAFVLSPSPGAVSGSGAHFKPQPRQNLTAGFRIRMTPGSAAAGTARVEYLEWRADGSRSNSIYGSFVTIPADPTGTGAWTWVSESIGAAADANTATVQCSIWADGSYDIDGFTARDAEAGESGVDPSASSYLRGATFEAYVTAESVCTSGSAADVAAANSVNVWGRREAILNNDQIVAMTSDAVAALRAYFQRAAILLSRPKVTLIGRTAAADIVLPSDAGLVAISGTGRDIAPQWCSKATYTWKRATLTTDLELSNERPTLAKLLLNAASSGSASLSGASSVGSSSVSGGGGTVTPAEASVTVTDSTGDSVAARMLQFSGASVAQDGTNASQADISITAMTVGAVPVGRNVATSGPLMGGGSLSGDLTLGVSAATASSVGVVKPDGTTITVATDGTLSALAGRPSGAAPISVSGSTISISTATESASGAMSALDKTKLDGISTGATNTPLASSAPGAEFVGAGGSTGTSTSAARMDHVHAMPSVFGAAGSGHTAGFVPDPGATTHATPYYLGDDGAWHAASSGSSGTVTSVGLSLPSIFAVSGTPITGSGTLTASLATQGANTVLAGPMSGSAAAPAFRLLGAGDLPVMRASGSGHGAGAAPDPGASAGTARFLREDAIWATPPGSGGSGVVGAEIRMGANAYSVTNVSALISAAGQASFEITLPGAGTYLVQCMLDIQAGSVTDDDFRAQLYNMTAGAPVTNTVQPNGSIPANDSGQIILSAYVTAIEATTIGVYVVNNTASRGMVPALSSHLWYTQLTSATSAYNTSISGFTPNYGLSGTGLTIMGAGFTGASGVTINGTAASSFTVNSDTSITAVVPSETTGTSGPVIVAGLGGSATSVATYYYQSAATGGIKGYVLGGYTGSTASAVADKLTFATITTAAVSSANLSQARFTVAGIAQQASKGYAIGGGTAFGANASAVTTADKTTFSTDTTAVASSANLTAAVDGATGVSQGSTNGYVFGGRNTSGTDVVTAYTVTFATDSTTATSSANLSGATERPAGISAGQTNGKGYLLGGYSNGTNLATANKITFSTSTTAAQSSANLSQSRYGLCGVSDGATVGYALGGYTSTYVATADKVTFSTDTGAAASSANLSVARQDPAPISQGSANGYIIGGLTSSGSVITDQLTYSSNATSALTSANLSTGRGAAAGYSDQGF